MTEDKRTALTVDVSITDTEVFKEFLGVISKIVMDQRMPSGLRDDALTWLNDIGASAGTVIYAGHPYELIVVLCENVSLGKLYWQQIKHKYSPYARIRFIGQGGNPDGLRPDKVVLVGDYQESAGYRMNWINLKGEFTQVIDETGDIK
ncbi:hypothetical protein PAECIP112173_00333 [Paenibacillus sp. JJ-100]|uniref:hypothetical protein n=1 Tax=Paenibacillus sp. JJ-100 TaxID=2974896 RepID=UPI0022FF9231|nr:hypothetical protein [Paenibacillus sp. JJ-100]CAI6023199.1 hypothetical protein PAECIP112173_00333 [Paenibacillus sp. JJ-100]